jgi:hypothetical protein
MGRTAGLSFAAVLVAAGIIVWTSSVLSANSDPVEPAKPAISGYDVHLRTNVKDLPIQDDGDAF